MPRGVGRAIGALLVAAGCLGGRGAAAQTLDRVRAGVVVRPDTVTVGDPFRVLVRVQAPAGTIVTFPAGPDTTGAVAARDPRRVDTTAVAGDTLVDLTATYTLAAWDIDVQAVPLGEVQLRLGDVQRRVPLGGYTVFVESVLPADTALRVPKPPRLPMQDAPSLLVRYWPWILAALVAIALLVWTFVRWLRRRRAGAPPPDAYARAVAELARIERLGLVEAGERGRLVALSADALRDYLAARLLDGATSRTSTELLDALAGRGELPHDRLATLLADADLVKFAAVPVSADAARAAHAEARALVDEIERAVRAREQREAEEAAQRAKQAREDARRYEQERRRAAKRRKAA